MYFVSDGSCNIMVWDQEFHSIEQKCIVDPFNSNKPLQNINELEFVNDQLFANVWMKDRIAVIDYEKGEVVRWIDFSILLKWVKIEGDSYVHTNAVLNGIAYNPTTNSLFITGKLWNRLFEIELL